jgi:sulfate adenylyltransferase subunit 1 (EFTu-like GTPase family)
VLPTRGLRAERDQGITIDISYRYLAAARCRFIIGDHRPRHRQNTRPMVTGASVVPLHDYSCERFAELVQESDGFAGKLSRVGKLSGVRRITCVPMSTLHGGFGQWRLGYRGPSR